MLIEFWGDIICPYCGLMDYRLQRALERFEHRAEVEVIHRSFPLHPELPREGVTQRQLFAIAGIDEAVGVRVLEPIERAAAAEGLTPYHALDRTMGPTALAHELLAYAAERGRGTEIWTAMFRAHFGAGRNLWTPDQVLSFAAEMGLDHDGVAEVLRTRRFRARVLAEQREAQRLGARGVPFIVLDGRHIIRGSVETDELLRSIARAWTAGPDALLFSSYRLGELELKNRVVMAPMTRSRATGNVPNALMATYYAQRAEAGLIVTEGTSPAPDGLGYARIPALFNDEHVRGWRTVTEAVHREGARIFAQLMHAGRVSHPENLPNGARSLAPSAIAPGGAVFVDGKGELPMPVPEAMTDADIERTIEQYARSAELAMKAGFDGVELHGGNGYLIDQFLDAGANRRTDEWGGSIENRTRFGVAVAERVASRIGAHRVGMRVSPYGAYNGMRPDDDVEHLHESFARALSDLGLVYMHIVDHSSLGAAEVTTSVKRKIREAFHGTLILSGGYDLARATADLAERRGDLVAFGRHFLANPRLVTRLREGKALSSPDPATFYTPGEKGYTDYLVDP